MRRWGKIGIGAVVVVVALAGGAAAYAWFGSEAKMHRHVAVTVAPIAIPDDAAALERGRYLYTSRGCLGCHSADGAGGIAINEGGLFVQAPQIAPVAGSVTANYQPEDWVRTIRHGVKPNGEPAFIMPSEDYNRLTDADTGAIVAYVRSLPAKPGKPVVFRAPLLVRFLYAIGYVKDAAEKIDHTLPPQQPPAEGDVLAHGAYVAATCRGCHNLSLSGGPIPGTPPSWPPAANLTSGDGSVMPRYPNAEAFIAMFRSGHRPDGTAVSTVMPFEMLRVMSDDDVQALYAYLKTVPPKKQGEQS